MAEPNSVTRERDRHLFDPGPKRMLALDGGGVRGAITVAFLERIEEILRQRLGKPAHLGDWFDLIGGTSTGGIIAAMLCLGMSVEQIRTAYLDMCPKIFRRRRKFFHWIFNPYSVFAPNFDAEELHAAIAKVLKDVLITNNRQGHGEPLLDSDLLQTGLALVTKRIDTGSVWVLTNNARAKFWDPDSPHWKHSFKSEHERFFPNGRYPLALLARATASAPFLLDAAELAISPRELGVFLDGGASPFNNPALELFLTTTLKEYDAHGRPTGYSPNGFDWEASEDQLLLYSAGTGSWRTRMSGPDYQVKQNWEKAKIALLSMIDDGMKSSLMWLQGVSEPTRPAHVDGNLERMANLRISQHKLLTFHRCNLTFDSGELQKYLPGETMTEARRDELRQLDNARKANLARLDTLGRNFAEAEVLAEDLPAAFDPYPVGPASRAA